MRLFEIREELERLIDSIDDRIAACVDPETGEVVKDVEAEYGAIQDEIAALEIARDEKREGVACAVLGIRAEAEAIRAQERVLFLRRKGLENKADRLAQYLEHDLNGENFTTARVAVKWRPSASTEISDEFLPWAKQNGLTSLIRTKEEPDKTAIGKLLKAGQTFPGAQLVTHNNMSIK